MKGTLWPTDVAQVVQLLQVCFVYQQSREWRSKRQASTTGEVWSTVGGQQASNRSTICSLCKEEEEEPCRRDLRGSQTYLIDSGSLLLGTRMRSSESQPDHDKVGLWASSSA